MGSRYRFNTICATRSPTVGIPSILFRPSGFGIFTDMQGLSIQFRAAYNNYRTDYNFEAYRAIHGYDFETATEDFWDVRLYLDYRF